MELFVDPNAQYSAAAEDDRVWKSFCIKCPVPQRYLLTFMGFLGLVVAYSMRLSLSVAITQMVPPPIGVFNFTATSEQVTICPYADENYLHEHYDYQAIFDSLYNANNDVYDWSQEQQGIILSAFYWGFAITQIPAGILSQRYGGKYVFVLGILLSAVCSLLTPNVVQMAGSNGLLALRVVSGLGEGTMYSGLTDLLAAWVPQKERTTLGSLAYGGSTVGTIGGTYLAALFIHQYKSWHQVFYFFGLVSIGWCFAFIVLCYNTPDCHPFITDEEKKYLQNELGQQQRCEQQEQIQRRQRHQDRAYQPSLFVNESKQKKELKRTPWRQILTSVPFIALILCQVSHEWAFCVIVLDLPKYMNDVLHFSIQDNGIYSSIPQAIKLIMALTTGALNDWLIAKNHLTITSARKIFVAFASVFTGVFIVAASYAECEKVYVVAFFTISVAFQGVPGVAINSLDLSPNYAGILMGIGGTITSIVGIVVPYMVGVVTPNSLLIEWRSVFWITFGLQLLKMFIFSCFGSGDVQTWDSFGTNEDNDFLFDEEEGDDYDDDPTDEDTHTDEDYGDNNYNGSDYEPFFE